MTKIKEAVSPKVSPSPSISASVSYSYSEYDDDEYYYKINKRRLKRYVFGFLFGAWIAGIILILGYTFLNWQYWFIYLPVLLIYVSKED
jgi:hypothetical protein